MDIDPSLPDLRETLARRSVDKWLGRQGLTLERLNAGGKTPFEVEARRMVARFLRAGGWSFPAIGAYLERDNSSIQNLLKPRGRARRVA